MTLVTFEPQGESTLIAFYKQQASGLDKVGRNMMNFLARSLMERGWLPSVSSVIEQMSEEFPAQLLPDVLNELKRQRMLKTDADGKRITEFLGSISLVRTPNRGELEPGSGNFLFTHGGLELLALGPIFGKDVECNTVCAQTGEDIHIVVKDEQIVEATTGIAGFAANWDGKAPLSEVAKNSPLFINDAALDAWCSANSGIDGLPLSGDLLLWMGMGMMRESGDARHNAIAG